MERKEPTIGSFDEGYAPPASRVADGGDSLDRPRNPWLAFIASILCPPIAFAYVGRPLWIVVLVAAFLASWTGMGLTGWVQSVGGIWLLYISALGLLIAQWSLPVYFARRAARHYRLTWYNRWYWYVLFLLVVQVPSGYWALHRERYLGFDTYRVPSGSMEPTIRVGDFIVADTRPAVVDALKAGDVVVMASFKRADELWVKRIVAGPGQHVQIDAAGLKVDGTLQSRAHTQGQDLMDAKWMHYADVTLGADEFYVMGDNRGNSFDSRTEGPVKRNSLRGKVTAIYYARDAARIGKVD